MIAELLAIINAIFRC